MQRRDASLLAFSVGLAFVPRLLTNVVLRPEFVGWFNHSPYYWVQARSLLQDGRLAYEDMPLLFALYAGLGYLFNAFGISIDDAVIIASRLCMAVSPALIPLVVYSLARKANAGNELSIPCWSLVFASGFLPLSYVHMPETLQKNMLGMLLLAGALLLIYRWLERKSAARLASVALLLAIILLTHLGSALAALLLVVAATIELAFESASRRTVVRYLSFAVCIAGAFVIGIYYAHPDSMDRVLTIINAFTPGNALEALGVLFMLVVWSAVLFLLRRWLARKSSSWNPVAGVLARVIVIWALLLVVPLWPGEIGMRLTLFLPLGLLMLLLLVLSQTRGNRLFNYVGVGVTMVFFVMSIGEAVSSFLTYPNKGEIALELKEVKQRYQLQRDDLVITPYGVGPTANWFLGTKASLLTAVNPEMFGGHTRVFVMNTLERPAPVLNKSDCRIVASQSDRYWITRHDVPLGTQQADPVFNYIGFYSLDTVPADWVFNDDGVWIGWGHCIDSEIENGLS